MSGWSGWNLSTTRPTFTIAGQTGKYTRLGALQAQLVCKTKQYGAVGVRVKTTGGVALWHGVLISDGDGDGDEIVFRPDEIGLIAEAPQGEGLIVEFPTNINIIGEHNYGSLCAQGEYADVSAIPAGYWIRTQYAADINMGIDGEPGKRILLHGIHVMVRNGHAIPISRYGITIGAGADNAATEDVDSRWGHQFPRVPRGRHDVRVHFDRSPSRPLEGDVGDGWRFRTDTLDEYGNAAMTVCGVIQ